MFSLYKATLLLYFTEPIRSTVLISLKQSFGNHQPDYTLSYPRLAQIKYSPP